MSIFYKRCLPAVLVACSFMLQSRAQSFLGYHSSSYSGVYGTLYNPANILDNRFRADINLVGIAAAAHNNGFRLNLGGNVETLNIPEPNSGKITKMHVQADAFGPGFMLRLSDNDAIAITSRARAQTNIDGAPDFILNTLRDHLLEKYDGKGITVPDMRVQAHAWTETNFTYSRQIAISDFGVWKAAATIKLLGGQYAAYTKTNNLRFTYRDSVRYDAATNEIYPGIENVNGNINWNYSASFDNGNQDYKNIRPFRNPSVGLDIGLTYEFRDDFQVYETNYNENTLGYKWKMGVSITDIGNIKYDAGGNDFNAVFKGQSYELNDLQPPADADNVSLISNFYKGKFTGTEGPSYFTMSLPTAMHLMFDYSFNKWMFMETHFSMPLKFTSAKYYAGTFVPTMFSVTPRAELPWGGLYLPISYNNFSGVKVGGAMRVGPLVIGSASAFSFVAGRKTRGADVYVILRVPLFRFRTRENQGGMEAPEKLSRRARRALRCS